MARLFAYEHGRAGDARSRNLVQILTKTYVLTDIVLSIAHMRNPAPSWPEYALTTFAALPAAVLARCNRSTLQAL